MNHHFTHLAFCRRKDNKMFMYLRATSDRHRAIATLTLKLKKLSQKKDYNLLNVENSSRNK